LRVLVPRGGRGVVHVHGHRCVERHRWRLMVMLLVVNGGSRGGRHLVPGWCWKFGRWRLPFVSVVVTLPKTPSKPLAHCSRRLQQLWETFVSPDLRETVGSKFQPGYQAILTIRQPDRCLVRQARRLSVYLKRGGQREVPAVAEPWGDVVPRYHPLDNETEAD
jgi:hypothetical protein